MLTYAERATQAHNKAAQRLFEIMVQKNSNLSVAADVTTSADLLELTEKVAPYICLLKTHLDIISDFTPDLTRRLSELAHKHNFLIFEDRKFADIGNTVRLQYAGGLYRIAEWAQITNAHLIPGPGIISGLSEVGLSLGNGLLLLAQMSAAGTLASGDYTQKNVAQALANLDFVIGFICTERLTNEPGLLHLVPGVHLEESGDTLGQQYTTPQSAIERGADIIIVGRAIYRASDPAAQAKRYQEAGWTAYLGARKFLKK